MRLRQKIKSYFRKFGFHAWKNPEWDDGYYFSELSDGALVELASRLRDLEDVPMEDRRFRLREKSAVTFASIDTLLAWLTKIVASDFEETSAESKENNWEFRYVLKPHRTSFGTWSVSNMLTSIEKPDSHCVYALASIRKHGKKYYCWTF